MNGEITRALYNCLLQDSDCIDLDKFYRIIPKTLSTRQSLSDLERQGYVVLDFGDDTITEIAITHALRELFE